MDHLSNGSDSNLIIRSKSFDALEKAKEMVNAIIESQMLLKGGEPKEDQTPVNVEINVTREISGGLKGGRAPPSSFKISSVVSNINQSTESLNSNSNQTFVNSGSNEWKSVPKNDGNVESVFLASHGVLKPELNAKTTTIFSETPKTYLDEWQTVNTGRKFLVKSSPKKSKFTGITLSNNLTVLAQNGDTSSKKKKKKKKSSIINKDVGF
jgi:hypothetical protein